MALFVWGANSYGQLGTGCTSEQYETPVQVQIPEGMAAVEQVEGGGGHTFVRDSAGKLWSCGWNSRGQLGVGDRKNRNVLTEVPLDLCDGPVRAVACGWDFTLVATVSGNVFGCGSNAFGQLGLGEECKGIDGLVPVKLPKKIVGLACGLRHALFLSEDGEVFGCGSNKKIQLGLPNEEIYWEATKVEVGKRFQQVSAGQHFSLALTEEGRVMAFGYAGHNQLLNQTNRSVVKELELGSSVIREVHCGWTHAAALLESGEILTWGRNNYHQLGRDEEEGAPVKKVGIVAEKLSCGSEHCLVVRKEDGSLVSWGWNEHGNCGNGSVQNVPSPTAVQLPPGKVTHFVAASGHNVAVVMNI